MLDIGGEESPSEIDLRMVKFCCGGGYGNERGVLLEFCWVKERA